MCVRVLSVLTLVAAIGISTGCQQTPGVPNGLSPAAPYSAANQLQPVSGVGPFGGSTRVPPPPTGGFNVPNNYMGGAPIGQTSATGNPSNGFANTPASGWVQSGSVAANGTSNANNINRTPNQGFSPSPMATASIGSPLQGNPMRPQSGGMNVIDMTNSPPPPGYAPNGGFMPNAIGSGVAPASYVQGFGSGINAPIAQAYPNAGTVFRANPNADWFASPQNANQNQPLQRIPLAAAPVNSAVNGENPNDPAINRLENKRPSTEPVRNEELSWRRPSL